jgi:predicted nucleic acid-binding protein
VIVVDASAALSALYNHGAARRILGRESLHAPHLIDSEITSGVRRRVQAGSLTADQGWQLLDVWSRLGIVRHPMLPVLQRVWELRDNLSAYDAGSVALAEFLGCGLLTADGRLSRASGIRCPVTVIQ